MSSTAAAVHTLVCAQPFPRIHVLSDLHLERGPYQLPAGLDFDVLLAAGDIGPPELSVPWLAALDKPVVYVLGNHEHYGSDFGQALLQAKQLAQGTQVHVLECESVTLHGVRFLGTTLWSSYGDWERNLVLEAMRSMCDYREITARAWFDEPDNLAWLAQQRQKVGLTGLPPDAESAMFHPAIAYQQHLRSVAWLTEELARDQTTPSVVVTHHAPHYSLLEHVGVPADMCEPAFWRRGYRSQEVVRIAAYASDLGELLAKSASTLALWAHGHLHTAHDSQLKGVRVVCNPRGHHLPAMTEQGARALALLGLSLSRDEVAADQAAFEANPYRGDGFRFEAEKVIRLEDGLAAPLRAAVREPLMRLRVLRDSVAAMLPYRFKGATKQQEAVERCIAADVEAFSDELAQVHQTISVGVDPDFFRGVLCSLGAPPALYAPRPRLFSLSDAYSRSERRNTLAQDYERLVEQMDEWLRWVGELPDSRTARLADWAAHAYRALSFLAEHGIEATVRRPPVTALRQVNFNQIRLLVAQPLSDERRAMLESALDALPRRAARRDWLQWLETEVEDTDAPALTLAELAPWDRGLSTVPDTPLTLEPMEW